MSNFGDHPTGFFDSARGFYNGAVSTSLRFDDGSAHYLSRDQGSAGNQKVFTLAFWVKRAIIGAADTALFGVQTDGNNRVYMRWEADDTFKVYFAIGGTGYDSGTTMKFRDTSAWYHVAVVVNMSGSGDTGKLKIYVNGVNQTVTYGSTLPDSNTAMNSGAVETLGKKDGATNYMDGYLADVYLIDGTAVGETSGYLDEFGEVKEGVWIPKKYTGSYGTNGFHLEFTSSAHDAPASEGSADTDNIGADSSGQNHHWTAVDSISADDCAMPDSPENNFATSLGAGLAEPTDYQSYAQPTSSEGNLKVTGLNSGWTNGSTNFGMTSGKWYAEVIVNSWVASNYFRIGLRARPARTYDEYFVLGNGSGQLDAAARNGRLPSFTTGDVIQLALDLDNNAFYLGKNNTWGNSATATEIANGTTTNAFASGSEVPTGDGHAYFFYAQPHSTGTSLTWNFGQDSSFAGAKTAQGNSDSGDGTTDFFYTPPNGFLACNSVNLPELDISPNSTTQADDHFNTVLYTGTNSTNNVTGVGFQPDWVWIKRRNASAFHPIHDSSRPTYAYLRTSGTNAENTTSGSDWFRSFDSDGFTVVHTSTSSGTTGQWNQSGGTFVAWNWKANGGTTVTNEDGSIDSTVQANTTAGFSIVTYTGTGSAITVGHGLGTTPDMFIVKRRNGTSGWATFHKDLTDATQYIQVNDTGGQSTGNNVWNQTDPTSTVFTVGTDLSVNTGTYVAYCFAEVEGYSRFGKYTGNGNANGTFVFTGFRPAMVIIKQTNSTNNWRIIDNERDGYNGSTKVLYPSVDNAEGSEVGADLVSNGFKLRADTAGTNASGGTFIYMAFAEAPFKYANAR